MIPASDLSLIVQIDNCFYALNGAPLPCPAGIPDRYRWLHENAPYSLLAHHAGADPHFIYANRHALYCFQYTPDEMLSLPSRLSAAEKDRPERERFLQRVIAVGIVYHYTGLRVDKYGNAFAIHDGILWQLKHPDGTVWGQAALFWSQAKERPDWYADPAPRLPG